MAFKGTEGRPIAPSKAGSWTQNYQKANPGRVQGHFFSRKILLALLDQPGTQGIRFYYGLQGDMPQLLAVGADAAENDQLGEGFLVVDESTPCPPYCGEPNVLNGGLLDMPIEPHFPPPGPDIITN